MSQIRKSSLALGLLLSLFTLSGCGDKNSQATFDPATTKHIGDQLTWKVSTHKSEALARMENCTECHGSDLTGGISNVNCATQCHLGVADSAHPLAWGKNTAGDTTTIILGHKFTVDPASCTTSTCHATGGAAQQKLCTTCHTWNATSRHPLTYDFTDNSVGNTVSHKAYINSIQGGKKDTCAVASCHGSDLSGGITARSCKNCHANITVSGIGTN